MDVAMHLPANRQLENELWLYISMWLGHMYKTLNIFLTCNKTDIFSLSIYLWDRLEQIIFNFIFIQTICDMIFLYHNKLIFHKLFFVIIALIFNIAIF